MRGGDEVSPSIAKHSKDKGPYTREDKGKAKLREFKPRLQSFICDDMHLARKCPKREALITLIKEQENQEADALLGLIKMLGALQSKFVASSQGIEAGEWVKILILQWTRVWANPREKEDDTQALKEYV